MKRLTTYSFVALLTLFPLLSVGQSEDRDEVYARFAGPDPDAEPYHLDDVLDELHARDAEPHDDVGILADLYARDPDNSELLSRHWIPKPGPDGKISAKDRDILRHARRDLFGHDFLESSADLQRRAPLTAQKALAYRKTPDLQRRVGPPPDWVLNPKRNTQLAGSSSSYRPSLSKPRHRRPRVKSGQPGVMQGKRPSSVGRRPVEPAGSDMDARPGLANRPGVDIRPGVDARPVGIKK